MLTAGPVRLGQISNRNRRRNKEKKKLRETAPEATSSPARAQRLPQQPTPGGGGRQADGEAAAAEGGGGTADGPAANYFSGRKRQKGDTGGQQGLGLLLDRDRSRGANDGRGGGADDTMEFMEVGRGVDVVEV